MKIKVIASTKVGYNLPKEEAIDFQENQQEYAIYQTQQTHYLQKIQQKPKEELREI